MADENVKIQMDRDLEKEFEAVCADVGMSMETAFTIFAEKTVREQRIPFEISTDIPNADTRKAMEDTEKGVGMSKEFASVDALMEDLDAEN